MFYLFTFMYCLLLHTLSICTTFVRCLQQINVLLLERCQGYRVGILLEAFETIANVTRSAAIATFPVIVMMDPPLGARCSKRGHAY